MAVPSGLAAMVSIIWILPLPSGDKMPALRWANLSTIGQSGRGPQFEDFGGDFVLEGPRGNCLSLSAGTAPML